MASYWAYGVDPEGDDQLLGPFDMSEAAGLEAEIQELRGVRIVYANNRNEALSKVRGEPAERRSLLTADQPAPPLPSRFQQIDDEEE